jgi:phosphoribosyl 1,2-cyclic phosphodiesterase
VPRRWTPGNLAVVDVTFFGTRGSCPCAGSNYGVFGGNTSCGLVRTRAGTPLILDLGTGLRMLGHSLLETRRAGSGPIRASVLLSHLHFDHIFGLPFFGPLLMHGAVLDVYGPEQVGSSLDEAMGTLFRPPFFPVKLNELSGSITFHDIAEGEFVIGDATVHARKVPHLGDTFGFRVEADGRSMAYIPDHQAPRDQRDVPAAVLELCAGADLVVHDAQYTNEEFQTKWHWGHSTADFAVRVAAEAGADRLLLFHHDPTRDDRGVAALERYAQGLDTAGSLGEVAAAREGTKIDLGSR